MKKTNKNTDKITVIFVFSMVVNVLLPLQGPTGLLHSSLTGNAQVELKALMMASLHLDVPVSRAVSQQELAHLQRMQLILKLLAAPV